MIKLKLKPYFRFKMIRNEDRMKRVVRNMKRADLVII